MFQTFSIELAAVVECSEACCLVLAYGVREIMKTWSFKGFFPLEGA